MKALKVLSLIIICATTFRIATAQTMVKENTKAAHQARRDGVITVRVVNGTGQPVAGATIIVYKVGDKYGRGWRIGNADDEGAFKATELGPGSYTISTIVPGYVVALTDSERNHHHPGENVTINLVKGGVITGRVTDAYGKPMVGVGVMAFKVRDLEGGQKYHGDGADWNTRLTDDRGVYRLYGLAPGVYVVGASSDQSGLYGGFYPGREAMTWHPSSPRATAKEIVVRSGEEVAGADIRHREERGHTISGIIISDTASEGINIMLVSGAGRQLIGMTSAYATKGFEMFGVPDGEYEMIAFWMSDLKSSFSSSTPCRVVVKGADVSGVELRATRPASISGLVKIEAPSVGAVGGGRNSSCEDGAQTKDRSSIEEISLSAAPDNELTLSRQSIESSAFKFRYDFDAMDTAPDEKGNFTLWGVAAGRFRIKADLPDYGWYIRAITQPASGAAEKPVDASRNGIAVKAGEELSGIEVVIAEGAASLNGRVVPANEESKLPSRLRVHLIPAEVSAADDVLRYAETMVRAGGGFEFRHVAPGKYLLHTRRAAETEVNNDQARPFAWDAVERAKLRREAAAAKNEIELKVCERVKDHLLRWQP
jgi:hypothetical protein